MSNKNIRINTRILRNQLNQDADRILDGIDWDHRRAAAEEDPFNDYFSTIFCPSEEDEKELAEAALAYASNKRMPRLKSSQRWRFAMRLRFASSLLKPVETREIKTGGKLFELITKSKGEEVTLWLLTEGILFCREIFNEIVFTSERCVYAPMRPPWMPDTCIVNIPTPPDDQP